MIALALILTAFGGPSDQRIDALGGDDSIEGLEPLKRFAFNLRHKTVPRGIDAPARR